MKRTIIAIVAGLLISPVLRSQENDTERSERNHEFRTLPGHDRNNGIYGAFSFGYSEIAKQNGVLFGGRI